MAYLVYMHENKLNKKKYVGITSLSAEERWQNGRHYEFNEHFSKAIKKYGWNGFDHKIIMENTTQSAAALLEETLIKELDLTNPNNGYNKSTGGEHSKPGPETRKKLSEARKGEKNNFYGKTHTEETRKLISQNRKGIYSGERHHMYGKKLDSEALEKLRNTGTLDNFKKSNERFKKPVLMIDKDTKEIIREFPYTGDAVDFINSQTKESKCKKVNIQRVCYDKRKTAYGYIWKYKEGAI